MSARPVKAALSALPLAFACATPALAGYNEGDWSPRLVGPLVVVGLCGLVLGPIGYALGKAGFQKTVRALTFALLAVTAVAVGATVYFFGDLLMLVTVLAMVFGLVALAAFALGAGLGAAKRAANLKEQNP